MTMMLEQITKLHEKGLHGSVKLMVSFALCQPEFNSLEDSKTVLMKYQLFVYYGDALFNEECYKQAEMKYAEALKIRRTLVKMKTKAPRQPGVATEVCVKSKLYECHIKQKNYQQAMTVLESITPKQRTSKLNMQLGQLYQKHGMERSAITCYKEVLRSSAIAVEAATLLLDLGVTLQEVLSLLAGTGLPSSLPEWFTQYLKGYAFNALNKHSKAVQQFKALELKSLHDNCHLLSQLAGVYHKMGDHKNSLAAFQRIRLLDRHFVKGMDMYAQLLSDQSNKEELQKLAEELTEIEQNSAESWIVMAYYCFACKQKSRAVYFAQKAHVSDITNVQGLVLKASLLHSLSKTQEAVIHYREAIRLAPDRFEPYAGLVECHMAAEKFKEAINVAKNAHKTVGASARTITLCAKVCAQEPQTHTKAKTLLKKALSHDPTHIPAVSILCELLMKDEQYEEAESLLRKQLEVRQTAKLFNMAADCLKEMGRVEDSVEMYSKALRLDPDNAHAQEGIQNVDRNETVSDFSDTGPHQSRDRSSLEDLELNPFPEWID